MTIRSRFGRLASNRNIAWRRVAAGILVPLLALLVLQVRYYAAQHVEDVDVATSVEEPPAIVVGPPASIAPPQPGADRPGGASFSVLDVRPLRPFQERAPPTPSL
ncbi:MAG: hypothetical protein DMD99_02190 [Candidatus Rokuibacteriota bacterium]|nr:MAG: hypothetical protein DMD99_02190 [Candidatus Rokubacteria bacterium]